MSKRAMGLGLMALVSGFAACNADIVGSGADGQVDLYVASKAGHGGESEGHQSPLQISLGGEVLVIDSVSLVLGDIELKREQDDDCAQECGVLNVAPLHLDLAAGAKVKHKLSAVIRSGIYSALDLKIRKTEKNPEHAALLALHPELENISIRVRGKFNGVAFTFTSDLSSEQKIRLLTPVAVRASGVTNLTLLINVKSWFTNPLGTGLIDPLLALKGQPLEALVKANIESSFDIFNDQDCDGKRDL